MWSLTMSRCPCSGTSKWGLLSLFTLLFPLLPTRLRTRTKSCHVDRSAFQLQEAIQQVSRQIVAVLDHFGHQCLLFSLKKGHHHLMNHLLDWILRIFDLWATWLSGSHLDSTSKATLTLKKNISRRARPQGHSFVVPRSPLKHGAFSLSITNPNGWPMLPFDWLIHWGLILACCTLLLNSGERRLLFSVLFYKYAIPFKQNSLQRKLRFLISISLSTCKSLSFPNL